MTLLLSQMETRSKGKKGGDAEPSARERQRRALCLCHAYASHARTRSPWLEHGHGEAALPAPPLEPRRLHPAWLRDDSGHTARTNKREEGRWCSV